jgi:hypothetical protein
VEVAEVADQFLIATKQQSGLDALVPDSSIGSLGVREDKKHSGKRKKKRAVNVVSFDEDEIGDNEPLRDSSDPYKSMSSSCSEDRFADSPNPVVTSKENFNKGNAVDLKIESVASKAEKQNLMSSTSTTARADSTDTKSAISSSAALSICRNDKVLNSFPPPEFSVYSSSIKSADCISVNSVYSDCSERLDLENMNLSGMEISPSQRLKPVRSDRGGMNGDCDSNCDYPLDSSSQDLIPVPNFDSCMAPELLDLQINLDPGDLRDLGIISPATPSFSSEATLPPNSERVQQGSNKYSLIKKISASDSLSSGKTSASAEVSSLYGSYDPQRGFMKSSDGGENDTIVKLKVILDREVETVAKLRAHCAEEKRKSTDQMKILEAKVESLTKENEILKHQLKKYVGAVQLLKKDNHGSSVKRMSSFDDDDDAIQSSTSLANGKLIS